MAKKVLLIGAIVLASVFILHSAQAAEQWTEVIKVCGKGIKQTDSFCITSHKWRIDWKSAGGFLAIVLYKADGSFIRVAATYKGSGQDYTIMRGAGDYYLKINATRPYTIIVRQKK